MKKAIEGSDSKSKRAISVRIAPESMEVYETLVTNAGLTVSEGIRELVTGAINAQQDLDLAGFNVKYKFTSASKEAKDNFAELLGSLLVEVTPPVGMDILSLHRLVFVAPEYWEGKNEPYRIDSAYFHRVAAYGKEVPSDYTTRNVLSFRLIDGKWRAGIFNYGTPLNEDLIVQNIFQALEAHIRASIACHLIGQLPKSRYLTMEEVAELNEVRPPE
jgi:predicted DNA-binding protein